MESARVVKLPAEVVRQLDARAAAELRSRNNMATVLVREGLERREADVPREVSR